MKTHRLTFLSFGLLVVAAACGSDSPAKSPDAGPVVPATVTVTGVAAEITTGGRVPQADVMIAAYKEGDTTPVAMTTSGADGSYTLMIPTGGAAVDGYVLAKKATYKDTYLYPPQPLTADLAGAAVLLVKPATYDAISALTQTSQDASKGFIAVEVIDATGMGVGDAMVSSTPAGTNHYNGTNGLPSADATMTRPDGIAYIMNVTAGTVTVNATKAGSTFHSHKLNARADQLTTTLIQ